MRNPTIDAMIMVTPMKKTTLRPSMGGFMPDDWRSISDPDPSAALRGLGVASVGMEAETAAAAVVVTPLIVASVVCPAVGPGSGGHARSPAGDGGGAALPVGRYSNMYAGGLDRSEDSCSYVWRSSGSQSESVLEDDLGAIAWSC